MPDLRAVTDFGVLGGKAEFPSAEPRGSVGLPSPTAVREEPETRLAEEAAATTPG